MPPTDPTTTPASPRARFAAGFLREHYEELEFLWGQRQAALDSPVLTLRYFRALEERIEAHVQGLLTGGPQLLAVVSEGLTGDDPLFAFAAAYPLLRLGVDSASQFVMNAFSESSLPGLNGIGMALCHGPITTLVPRLRQAVDRDSAPHSVAAAEVLGFHHYGDVSVGYIERLCHDADPAVRAMAWHAAWHARALHIEVYEAGLNDEEELVRWRAGVSAAWVREKWLMTRLRELVRGNPSKHWNAVMLLAILGNASDLDFFQAIGRNAELGPGKFAALASFGHPSLMDIVIAGIESKDPQTAVAAGGAFTRMTGVNIDSNERVAVGPDGATDADNDFADEVILPDPLAARNHWDKTMPQFKKSLRICHGLDVSGRVSSEVRSQLDPKSRWEIALRGAYEGTWTGVAADLERFPLSS